MADEAEVKSFKIVKQDRDTVERLAAIEGVSFSEYVRRAVAERIAGTHATIGADARSPETNARDASLADLAVRLEESVSFAARAIGGAVEDLRAAAAERRTNDEETLERFRMAAKIVHDLNHGLTQSLARAAGVQK